MEIDLFWCQLFLLILIFMLTISTFLLNLEASVQDCKEFQGELFGISNLFSDLSDKLFTSEIIELHEKQGEEDHGHNPSSKMDLSELETYFSQLKEANETAYSAAVSRKPKDFKSVTTLEDSGMLIFFSCFLDMLFMYRERSELIEKHTIQNIPYAKIL